VAGGLAALSGPRHGGESIRAAAILDEAARAPDLDRYLATRLNPGEHGIYGAVLSGFGHPLYPNGDPRARVLLDLLTEAAPARSAIGEVHALARAVRETTGTEPNLDYALASIERVLGLPAGAAFTLFAVGRVVGWIAHAMEQSADGRLIRPRARYIGEYEAPSPLPIG
jgi:citrate synthase